MVRPTKALVQGLLNLPPGPDPKTQKLFAELYRNNARADLHRKRGGPPCFGMNWHEVELQRELKLIDFAVERDIDLTSQHWRSLALSVAAFEHPKLRMGGRGRGRPRKDKGGLLRPEPPFEPDDKANYEAVENIKKLVKQQPDKLLSDRKAAGLMVWILSQQNEAVPIRQESPLFESRRKQVCSSVSRYRSYLKKSGKVSF